MSVGALGAAGGGGGGRRRRAQPGRPAPGALCSSVKWKGWREAAAWRPVSARTYAFQPAKLPQQHFQLPLRETR